MEPVMRGDEATRALVEIRAHQGRVLDALRVPRWYWWSVAALALVVGAGVDDGSVAVVVGVTVACGAIIAVLTAWVIVGGGRAQLSREALGERGVLLIVGFVWLLVAASVGVAFGLAALGVGHPALIGCAACAVGLVAVGPLLTGRIRRLVAGEISTQP